MNIKSAFTGYSNSDKEVTKKFYSETLGMELLNDRMGLEFRLPGGGIVFIYKKDDHQPATFTVLNLVVEDIDEAVKELTSKDVKFEIYDGFGQEESGIARSTKPEDGPSIAWFKDPSGNIISIIEKSFN
jgi:catechol 2,3-dioxygenase-like lactoylglutathione lyase family enzyme